jgi:hypothetical protein
MGILNNLGELNQETFYPAVIKAQDVAYNRLRLQAAKPKP